MKNRYFAILLVVATLINFNISLIFVNASQIQNETLSEYRVIDTKDSETGSLILYEHIKSGAKLIHWKNEDMEKGVGVAYRTYPHDNSGVNHVLEHCICAGSSEYGDTNLFFNVCGKVNSIFMNALTSNNFTLYAASTLHEKQLIKFTEMIMNCTLNPIFLKDERVFKREGHRLELSEKNGALKINGTVYNEMSESLSNGERVKRDAVLNTMLKGKNKFNAGGIPEEIEKLTYEKLKETWEKYYHPSNCLIIFYGDLDINPFLSLLDKKFLSNYEKRVTPVERPVYELIENNTDAYIKYPAYVKRNTENKYDAFKIYMIEKPKAEFGDEYYSYLAKSFLSPASSYSRSLHKEISYLNYDVVPCEIGNNIGLMFVGKSIAKNDISKFNDIVEKSIEEIKKDGFDTTVIDSFKDDTPAGKCSEIIQKRLFKDGIFEDVLFISADAWEQSKDDGWLSELNLAREKFDSDKLNTVFNYIFKASHREFSITAEPDLDKLNAQNRRKLEYLKKLKDNMTEEEKDKIVKFTKEMEQWLKNSENPETYKKINNITLDDLNVDIKLKEANEKYIDGVRVVSYEDKHANETYMNAISFGLENFSPKELALAYVLSQILGDIRTNTHSRIGLQSKIIEQFYRLKIMLNSERRNNKKFRTFLVGWQGLSATHRDALKIIEEIIFDSDFSDINGLLRAVTELKFKRINKCYNNLFSSMVRRGEKILLGDEVSSSPEEDVILDTMCDLERDLKYDPDNAIEKLKQMLEKILSTSKVTFYSISDKNSIESCTQEFFESFPYKNFKLEQEEKHNVTAKNKVKSDIRKEALITGSNLQSNGMLARYPKGIKYDVRFDVLKKIILDKYLMKNIRDVSGAYTCDMDFDNKGMLMISKADPGIGKTWNVFKNMGKWLDNLNLSKEEFDEYKVKTYCDNLDEFRNRRTSVEIVYNKLMNLKENIINDLDKIKNMTLEDLQIFIGHVKNMLEDGYYFTIGNEEKIDKEKDKFDNIIKLKGKYL